MDWHQRMKSAEDTLRRAEDAHGMTRDTIKDLVVAGVYALLAINDGLSHIYQEVSHGARRVW